MQRYLHLPHLRMQQPDWIAALAAGIVAGAVLMVLSLLWSATDMTSHPWILARRIAAITMGQHVLGEANFSATIVAVMALTHYGLGVIFALILSVIVAALHLEGSLSKVVMVGALFGLALYLVNFYLLADSFPWFIDMRGGVTMLAHLIFGMLAAGVYWKLEKGSVVD